MALLRVHPSSHRDPLFCLRPQGFFLLVAPASSHHAPASSHHALACSQHAPASSHHGPCLFLMACHGPLAHSPLTIGGFGVSQHSRWLSNIFTIFLTALRTPWHLPKGGGLLLLEDELRPRYCAFQAGHRYLAGKEDSGKPKARSPREPAVWALLPVAAEAAIPEEKECLGP